MLRYEVLGEKMFIYFPGGHHVAHHRKGEVQSGVVVVNRTKPSLDSNLSTFHREPPSTWEFVKEQAPLLSSL